MDIFEFVLVMVSLILAIGLTSLLREVSATIAERHSRHFDWVRPVWIAVLFLYVVAYWWSMWDFRGITWTFPTYVFLLLLPTSLYIAMDLFVRSGRALGSKSPQEAFEEIRVPFFLTMMLVQIGGAWDDWLLSVAPFWTPLRWIQVALILLFVAGTLIAARSAQRIIALAVLVILSFGMFALRYMPGAFGTG